jgi:C4-type Zn-finger protein
MGARNIRCPHCAITMRAVEAAGSAPDARPALQTYECMICGFRKQIVAGASARPAAAPPDDQAADRQPAKTDPSQGTQ